MCAPPIGSELELVLEVVLHHLHYLFGTSYKIAGRVFRVCNRGQVLIFEVQLVQRELNTEGNQSYNICNYRGP